MTNPLKPRIRKLAPKVRTGCKTCKRRRVKCDERKPACLKCEKLGIVCDGYEVPKPWLFEPQTPDLQPAVKTEDRSDGSPSNGVPDSECQTHQQALSKTRIHSRSPSRIDLIIPIKDSEGLLLLQSYIQHASECPVAWDAETYVGTGSSSDMTSMDVIRLYHGNPLTRMAHLAMATATLHLFRPDTYPIQLQLKYLHLAIAEVRKHILKRSFDVGDLLHGVSQIFLATVLIGDETAARAHLKAAKNLVDEQGGLNAIWPPTARTLKYGDLHLAVETVSPPVFGPVPAPPLRYNANDVLAIDPIVTRLARGIRSAASKESQLLSDPLVRCLCKFVEAAAALADIWIESSGTWDFTKLNWIAEYVAGVHNTLLELSGLQKQVLTTLQEDTRHTLVLWVLLFCFMANSTITTIQVWDNTVEMSNEVLSHPVSPCVRQGLKRWNRLVSAARRNPRARRGKADEDLLELICVVTDMEAEQSVRVGSLMLRLWELRRLSRVVKQSPLAARQAFVDWFKEVMRLHLTVKVPTRYSVDKSLKGKLTSQAITAPHSLPAFENTSDGSLTQVFGTTTAGDRIAKNMFTLRL